VKLRRSVRLQIKALNKDIPYGHQWTTAFLFDGRKLFLMTVILHILRIAFANTLYKHLGNGRTLNGGSKNISLSSSQSC